jgi:hypothetical protein
LVLYKDAGGITGTVRAKSSLFYARKNVNDWINDDDAV